MISLQSKVINLLSGMILIFVFNQCLFSQTDRIELVTGQKIFSSGMNMAWGSNFAANAVDPDFAEFTRALDEISEAGGNTMRWWLHINGTSSPQYANDTVSSISQAEINNVKKILDLAFERKMTVCISLWSHDMLNGNAGSMVAVNQYMLADSVATMAYINNALIPLVNTLKGHPGILCWEIFNEPEGMISGYGWTGNSTGGAWTTYPNIKRFTNLCAGAIHRTDPNALVTTGTHKASYLAQHYTDNVLISAGGDSLGTLDFYQAHYYSGFGEGESPFAHPYSYWSLDKPFVVGEFAAHGPNVPQYGTPNSVPPTTENAYKYLYDNGYAGAWSWTWTGGDGLGDVNNAREGMLPLAENHPDDIIIKLPPGFIENFEVDTLRIITGDSIQVHWIASDSSVVTLNDSVYSTIDSVYLSPDSTKEYILIATGDTYADTVKFTVTVLQFGNIEYFYANKFTIEPGDSTLLKWSVVGGDCCSIVTLNGDTVAGKDSLYVFPLSDSTFTLATDGPTPDTSMITIFVEESFTYFEAENAVTTGQATKKTSSVTNGGAYMDLRDVWTITWNNISVPSSGEYTLRVGYQLTYDSPKSQYLVVNGDTVATIEFTAPNNTVWLEKDINIQLTQELNSIAFHGFWNWMSFDYIAIQGATIVSVEEQIEIPEKLELSQNYPNPFNPFTNIKFTLIKPQKVKLIVYDVLGRKVKILFNDIAQAGVNSVKWHGENDNNIKMSSGIYFYRLETESGFVKIKKMVLVK
jgi:hypothetical protein